MRKKPRTTPRRQPAGGLPRSKRTDAPVGTPGSDDDEIDVAFRKQRADDFEQPLFDLERFPCLRDFSDEVQKSSQATQALKPSKVLGAATKTNKNKSNQFTYEDDNNNDQLESEDEFYKAVKRRRTEKPSTKKPGGRSDQLESEDVWQEEDLKTDREEQGFDTVQEYQKEESTKELQG